jgi:hypothetical protein
MAYILGLVDRLDWIRLGRRFWIQQMRNVFVQQLLNPR